MDFPAAPCPECCQRYYGEEGKVVWIYCEHTQSGSVRFWGLNGAWEWRTYSPITLANFLNLLNIAAESFGRLKQKQEESDKAMDQILANMPEEKFFKT